MIRALALALVALPLAMIGVELSAHVLGLTTLAASMHDALAPLCHQDPSRSPMIAEHALGACWRCLGAHLGALVLLAAWGTRWRGDVRAAPWLLALGLADWAAGRAGLSADVALERVVSGAALGVGVVLACAWAGARMGRRARDAAAKLRARWRAAGMGRAWADPRDHSAGGVSSPVVAGSAGGGVAADGSQRYAVP